MEHFKKRLIHLHQKPLVNSLCPKPLREDGDDDASSNSSASSGSNGMMRIDNKKENNSHTKIARKRAVCRSKFRHNSLKIFKLGTSIPTSLCKSKEPYNVSAEKNLQLCCEDENNIKNNKKEDKSIQKESITEQIINSIEGINKKENLQRSNPVNLDNTAKVTGKHSLPAIIPEIPLKKSRSSLSRSSEDEQKTSGNFTPADESEQIKSDDISKPKLVNGERKIIFSTETHREHINHAIHNNNTHDESKESKDKYELFKKLKSISPDSTFTEKDTFQYKQNSPNVSTLPVNIKLPHNTSITSVHTNNSQMASHSFNNNSFQYSKSTPLSHEPQMDNPINLSVKNYNKNESNTSIDQYKPLPTPDISKNKKVQHNSFPEISQQISRLQKMPLIEPFGQYKSVDENVIQSTAQLAYSVMFAPFSLDNLILLNCCYKKLLSLRHLKNLSADTIRHLRQVTDEIISYVNSKLFDSKSPICRNYTQQIMEYDLEPHKILLNDVLNLTQKKCNDPEWMGRFFMILARNERKYPEIFNSNHLSQRLPNNWLHPSQYALMTPLYYNTDQHALHRKTYKPRAPQTKRQVKIPPPLYIPNDLKNGNYSRDSRWIPPKAPCVPPDQPIIERNENNCNPSLRETKKSHSEKINKKNNSHVILDDNVIIKDKSMVVTKDKVDLVVEKHSKLDVIDGIKKEKSDKNRTKNISLDDLQLFKEFLKQENKDIYNRILNKIHHVKEVKEVITIDDEEVTSPPNNKLRDILSKSNHLTELFSSKYVNVESNSADVIIIPDDTEDKKIKEDFNQNYISVESVPYPETNIIRKLIADKDLSKATDNIRSPSVEKKISYKTDILKQHSRKDTNKKDLKLEIKNPYVYKIAIGSNPDNASYQIIESPEVFTPPNSAGRSFSASSSTSTSCRTPENLPKMFMQSPIELISPVTPCSSLSFLSTKPEANSNWKTWITEERKKGLLDARQPTHRRQSIETISSVGSDYSPNLDHDDNVKIRIDTKWYRVKRTVMDCIPRGKLCYVRERNSLIRYFDDNQLAQFIQNMNINLTSPGASDFLKQIRERVDGFLTDDIYIAPYETSEKNEVIQLSEDISFSRDDYISVPELYVEEVEKVERFVPKDFLSFYKYVTGYQIVNNHHPISFQTFLTMHNTNGIKLFYKKYLLSILENKYV